MHNTNIKARYLATTISRFLKRKMVFVGGPRQVGKTTMAVSFLSPATKTNLSYLNWDDIKSKTIIKSGELPKSPLLVFDEIHKYKRWRNLIKGYYDRLSGETAIIVTGSARLDFYRRGGDSLMGRYRYLRLHPFTLNELKIFAPSDLRALLKFGGFPDPLFSQSDIDHKLWLKERLYRIVNDDIRDLENVREYNLLENLAELLPSKVGSPLSVKSLSEDLEVNHRTVESWLDILEKVYYCYRIAPFGAPKIRAVKKAKKLYLWDWSAIPEPGFRFENLVAGHLLKYCHYYEDTEGDTYELRYLRDTDLREIDFVVLKNTKPLFAVECKTGEKGLSKHIEYFKTRTKIPAFYQVHLGVKDYVPQTAVRVLPFTTFCKELSMV